MAKYYQKIIPQVNEKLFEGMKLGEIKRFVSDFFDKSFNNTRVKNIHKGITVELRKSGLRHMLHARNVGYKKLKAVIVLDKMIKYAEYTNFNEPDQDDTLGVLGYLNFKCKVSIEGKLEYFRIVVRLTTSGKFYYDHSVRINKKPTN